MQFDGQQNGERILTVITPHRSRFIISLLMTISMSALILAILFSFASYLSFSTTVIRWIMTLISLSVTAIACWWIWKTQTHDKTYITDRRIIRFDIVTPFFTNKRALFWNEVLKVKAYAPNMLFRLMKVGILQIEPVAADQESITIPDVYYHEDLANYIDKIVFTFKNKPPDMDTLKPFIRQPKGKRD